MKRLVVVALLPLIANCAGSGAADRDTMPGGADPEVRGVAAAELPWEVVDREGGAVSKEEFYAALGKADAVCVGESHRNPHHHWLQLHLLEVLTGSAGGERSMALGMEMFQRPFQRVLDDFRSGAIDEESMLTRTGWKVRWGYDYKLYKPMIDLAVERGLALLALNAPKELTRKIGREGIEALTDAERAQLPELDLEDAEHRAWFDGVMSGHAASAPHGTGKPHGMGKGKPHGMGEAGPHGKSKGKGKGKRHGKAHGHGKGKPHGHGKGHGGGGATSDRVYTAQVTWDETMAATAAEWLQAQTKAPQVVILAGSGHCHDRAIVARIERRGPGKAVSVYPVIDTGNGEVAEALVRPKNDYIVVMKLPQ